MTSASQCADYTEEDGRMRNKPIERWMKLKAPGFKVGIVWNTVAMTAPTFNGG